ncbi:MAG: hypothetical protein E3J28_02810 [Desulfobacteraceae bacterium]|nr:MAG: hypothetical protein E3J28_02810 [Desulfobacteraceae bacterium]
MEAHEIMRIVVNQLRGLISQGNEIVKSGQNPSDVKIQYGVPGGFHTDFCNMVERVKQMNKNQKFGYDSDLES